MTVINQLRWDNGVIMDAVRGYLRELRVGRSVSQDRLAEIMGITKQALLDWEKGRTQDIKTGPMLKAVEYLQGKLEDIAELVDASLDQGIALAKRRLGNSEPGFSDDQREALRQEIFSISDEKAQEALALFEDLQARGNADEWINFGQFLRNGRARS